MTKQEFLAASLPYNLKCQYCGVISYDIDCDGDDVNHQYGNKVALLKELRFYKKYWIAKCGVKSMALKRFNNGDGLLPIIRPLDSLTKECVQAGYNNGKPFIPIVELAKMIIDLPDHNPYMQYDGVSAELHTDNSIFIIHKERFTLFERDEYRIITCPKQLQLFQQLLKWHYWPNMPEGEEVVYVNENFNPYK